MLTPSILIYGKEKKVLSEYQGSYKASTLNDFITNFCLKNGFGSFLANETEEKSSDYYEPY